MDRLFIINIINKYLTSTNANLIEIINTTISSYNLYSQEEASKKEVELLYNLFNKYPYYLLPSIIKEIKNQFYQLSNSKPEYKKYTILANGYFLELMPLIKKRIETEINGHLIYLITKYYEQDNKMPTDTKKILTTNLYSPDILVGYNILADEQYQQEELIVSKSQNFREKVSINNYKLYYRSHKTLFELVLKYFSSADFEKFTTNLEIILTELNKEDGNTKILDELIFDVIVQIDQSLIALKSKQEEFELLKLFK